MFSTKGVDRETSRPASSHACGSRGSRNSGCERADLSRDDPAAGRDPAGGDRHRRKHLLCGLDPDRRGLSRRPAHRRRTVDTARAGRRGQGRDRRRGEPRQALRRGRGHRQGVRLLGDDRGGAGDLPAHDERDLHQRRRRDAERSLVHRLAEPGSVPRAARPERPAGACDGRANRSLQRRHRVCRRIQRERDRRDAERQAARDRPEQHRQALHGDAVPESRTRSTSAAATSSAATGSCSRARRSTSSRIATTRSRRSRCPRGSTRAGSRGTSPIRTSTCRPRSTISARVSMRSTPASGRRRLRRPATTSSRWRSARRRAERERAGPTSGILDVCPAP